MVSPNPNGGTGAGGGAPPTGYDPYRMLIENLPLPADIFSLLAPTFEQFGSKLELDGASVMDFSKNVLPHYRVETQNGKIVLLHTSGEDTSNLLAITTFSFLGQSIGLFVFTQAETLAFDPDEVISTWRLGRPKLRARFITQPIVQQLELESDPNKRSQTISDLLSLDELLAVSNLSLDEQLENAYSKGRLDLLDDIPGLPEKLTETDRKFLALKIAKLAETTEKPSIYLKDLIGRLGLEFELSSEISGALVGSSVAQAGSLLWFLGGQTYLSGAVPGYHFVLGYLLNILAHESGSGKEISRMIFKYRLVTDEATLKKLITDFP